MQAVVEEYLARLRSAAWVLPREQAEELVAGIAEHLEQARTSGGANDEAAIRTVLDRLGEPEELVAAARAEAPPVAVPQWGRAAPERPRALHEGFAVGLLTLGSFVPVVGWLAGAVLLWTSRRWTTVHKVVGTLLVPGGPGLVLLLASMPTRTCVASISGPIVVHAPGAGADPFVSSPDAVEAQTSCSGFALSGGWGIAVLALWLLAPLIVAVWLWRSAQTAVAAEAPVVPGRGPGGWGALEVAGVVLLCVGGFVVPVVAPLVGLGLVLASSSWSARQRNIAGALVLVPLALCVLLVVLAVMTMSLVAGVELVLAFFGVALGPLAAGVYLALTLGRET